MNHIHRYIFSAALITGTIFVLASCNGKQQGASSSDQPTEEEHSEDEHTVTLSEEQINTVKIRFGKIEHKQLTAVIKANGNLRVPNNNKANITSLFGGVIKSIPVQVGDYVKKGQIIATIENPQFIQLQEEYLTVSGRIIYAEQELQRQSMLNEGNAGALKNKQSAETELRTLKTRRSSLQQQLRLMNINTNQLDNSNLRSALNVVSPIDGTISELYAKIGSYVDVSSPVAEVVDNSQLHLDLQIFEKDLPKLKTGQIIHFRLTNNPVEEYDARIQSIGSSFVNGSKTIAVHCQVNGNKQGLIDGMNTTGLVSLDQLTSPAVPDEAIVNADGKYYIFTVLPSAPHVHKDGESHEAGQTFSFGRVEVLKGVSEMGYTGITPLSDLPEQTQIVVKGAFFINAKLSNSGDHAH